MLLTGIPLRTCAACFVGASFVSVCSGDCSGGRKEVGDAAREGRDKGKGIVDGASDRASSIAHGIRDTVPRPDPSSASVAVILTGIQLGRIPVGAALLMSSCGINN